MSRYTQTLAGIEKDGQRINPHFMLAELQELENRIRELERLNEALSKHPNMAKTINEWKAEGIEEMLHKSFHYAFGDDNKVIYMKDMHEYAKNLKDGSDG